MNFWKIYSTLKNILSNKYSKKYRKISSHSKNHRCFWNKCMKQTRVIKTIQNSNKINVQHFLQLALNDSLFCLLGRKKQKNILFKYQYKKYLQSSKSTPIQYTVGWHNKNPGKCEAKNTFTTRFFTQFHTEGF